MESNASFGEVAKNSVRIITIIYALVKVISYAIIEMPELNFTFHRIWLGAAMVFFVFAVTATKRLTKRQLSVLVPMTLTILELPFVLFIGGDRLTYFFLIGMPLLSLLYVDIRGLLTVMLLNIAITALILLGLGMSLMSGSYSMQDELFNFIGIIVVYGLVFLLSRYSITAIVNTHKLKAALHAREKEYYLSQCQLMQESAGRVRSSRHDMKIHMAALKNFIAENKTENAVDYIDSFLGDIGESRMHSETGNLAFDSIVNYKLKDIEKLGVTLNMNLRIPPVIEIDDADIVIIIGNLLDNALESVAKLDDKDERVIKLNIALDNHALLIKIENPFNGELKEGMASLKGGSEHGHGLNNIKRSVEKYDGYLKISHDNNIFIVNILLHGIFCSTPDNV